MDRKMYGINGSRLLLAALIMNLFLAIFAAEVAANDLSGRWSGRWTSYSTGHTGPLRCNLIRLDDGNYEATFAGRFWKIVPFRYSVILYVEQDGPTVTLAGENHVGRRFGTFYYHAEADDCSFVATYTSCKDDGEFVMTRCCRFSTECSPQKSCVSSSGGDCHP